MWTWLTGSSDINQAGVDGNRSATAGVNVPGARDKHSMNIDITNQIIYMMGGVGYGAQSTTAGTVQIERSTVRCCTNSLLLRQAI